MKTFFKSPLLKLLVYSVCALFFLVVGIYQYVHQEGWFAQAQHAPGTLTAFDFHVRTDGRSEYCPRFEFTTPDGQAQTTYGDGYEACPTQPDKHLIGQSVTVYYDPADPSAGRLRHSSAESAAGLILGLLLFVILLAIGAIGYLRDRRKAAALAGRRAAPAARRHAAKP
jgi:hypothetical protein